MLCYAILRVILRGGAILSITSAVHKADSAVMRCKMAAAVTERGEEDARGSSHLCVIWRDGQPSKCSHLGVVGKLASCRA